MRIITCLALLVCTGALHAQQNNSVAANLDISGSSSGGSAPFSYQAPMGSSVTFTLSGGANLGFIFFDGDGIAQADMLFPGVGQIDVGPTRRIIADGLSGPFAPIFANTGGAGTISFTGPCIDNAAPTGSPFLAYQAVVVDPSQMGNVAFSAATEVTFTAPGNLPPEADAGTNQTVVGGCVTTLDGSASFDPESASLSYTWLQVGGNTTVSLSDFNIAQPTFSAPTGADTLVFELTVNDGTQDSCVDQVTVSVSAPTASFASDVYPLFGGSGYGCSGCHFAGHSTGLDLSGTASDVLTNLQAATSAGNQPSLRLDLATPSTSLILEKPTNTAAVAHGGGTYFAVGSADYNTILNWISEGACDN